MFTRVVPAGSLFFSQPLHTLTSSVSRRTPFPVRYAGGKERRGETVRVLRGKWITGEALGSQVDNVRRKEAKEVTSIAYE